MLIIGDCYGGLLLLAVWIFNQVVLHFTLPGPVNGRINGMITLPCCIAYVRFIRVDIAGLYGKSNRFEKDFN